MFVTNKFKLISSKFKTNFDLKNNNMNFKNLSTFSNIKSRLACSRNMWKNTVNRFTRSYHSFVTALYTKINIQLVH